LGFEPSKPKRGIVGGPVKDGEVGVLVSQVLKGASSKGTGINKIYLNDLNIKPCQSCEVARADILNIDFVAALPKRIYVRHTKSL